MKKGFLITVTLLYLGLHLVYAAEPGGAGVSSEIDLGEYTGPAPDSVDIEAGNITLANLNTNKSTFRWAGLVGNVSGNIVLADSSNDYMITWSADGNLVYASAGSPTWSALEDANASEVAGALTWLDGASSDNYTETFTGGLMSIGSNLFAISSDHANTTSSGGSTNWTTFSLTDNAGASVATDIVFVGEVIGSGNPSYNGTSIQFQMILPEDGTGGGTAVTPYNLWVELV